MLFVPVAVLAQDTFVDVTDVVGGVYHLPLSNCPTQGLTYTRSTNSFGCVSGASVPSPGSNTQVIFNDSGVLGADAGFTYVKATDTATLGALVLTTPLPATSGGTGFASYAIGDLLAASTTTALSKVAAVATGSVLASAGTGTLPAYTATPSLTSLTLTGASGNTVVVDTSTLIVDATNHRVGILTTAPSSAFSLGGDAARTVALERFTTSNTAGSALTLQAGGATSGATNKNGGQLAIGPGISTGTGTGLVTIFSYPGTAATSTTDNTSVESARFFGPSATFNNAQNADFQASFTTTTVLNAVVRHARVLTHAGYLYSIGGKGSDGVTPTTAIEIGKIAANGTIASWTVEGTNTLPLARSGSAGVVANGMLYILGGHLTSNINTAATTVYYSKPNADGTVGTWATTTALPVALYDAQAVYTNGTIYVLGGFTTAGAAVATVYYATVNANGTLSSWTTSSNALDISVADGAAFSANGYLYYIGGKVDNTYTNEIATTRKSLLGTSGAPGVFATSTSMTVVASEFAAYVANGTIYRVGGNNTAGTVIASIEYASLNADGTLGTWTASNLTTGSSMGFANGMAPYVNGYAYFAGSAATAVRYANVAKVRVAGDVDLIGLSGQYLANRDRSSSVLYAGDLYSAGNMTATGDISVVGLANLGNHLNLVGDLNVSSTSVLRMAGKALCSAVAPTISSGFGSSPSIPNNNGTCSFTINVGTGGSATSGVIGLPTANVGWAVQCTDNTTTSATVFTTKQTATSATTATIGNFAAAGTAAAWTASDILSCMATAY